MNQEELRKKIKKLEKDESAIFNICSSDMDVKRCHVMHYIDLETAEIELEKLRKFLNDSTTLSSIRLGDKTVYYNEQVDMHRKFGKIFADLARIQKEKFYNKLKVGKGDGEISRIANITQNILEETLDTAYDWLQKLGITGFSKEEVRSQYSLRVKVDYEILLASFFKEVEKRILMCFKKNGDAVMLDCEEGRTKVCDPIAESMTSVIYDLGAFENNKDYYKLLDEEAQRGGLIEKYADFVFDQTIEIGKYVIELLVQKQKMPLIPHNFNVKMIYEAYLQKYLNREISDNEFSDVLWTILGESLDNEIILSGIINFETIHNKTKKEELCNWNESQGYYLKDTTYNNVYYYTTLEDDEFIDYYDEALFLAQNEIEENYYMKRYREWYLDIGENELEENNSSNKSEYACEQYHIQIGIEINKLKAVESKVCNDYEKIEEVKICVDNFIKENKWYDAIALIDGRLGYVEWALFRAFEEQVKYKYESRSGDKIEYIGSLLFKAKNILDTVDNSIGTVLNDMQGEENILRTMALNVFRAACHHCYIQMEHFVLNMPDRQVEGTNLNEYKKWRTEYKAKCEKSNYQMMKQCEMIIIQGVNKGIALSCIFLLESRIPSSINEQQRRMMYQVAAQKYCPEQMINVGESYLTDSANATEALESYYWYLMAQQLTKKAEFINDAIKKIQMIVCREIQ
ncbi:MAG: hypothetical protein NC434_03170 [Ruminococcus sp.]|nr:hypothetical protein [Ruminococcus sp.]